MSANAAKHFLVLRHAPTAWNAAGRIQGRADIALTDEGRRMAAGWRMPAAFVGAPCLSSPLSRCLDTARAMQLDPVPDERLIEMDWGSLEGMTLAEMRAAGGEGFAAAEKKGLDFQPDDGESPRMVRDRAMAALMEAPARAVIVTHKGVMRALLSAATGWDMTVPPPVRLPSHGVAIHLRLEGGTLHLLDCNLDLGA
ncbi:histidine phosphatase family protein [Aliihoeflea sp. PC F10.4]